MSVESLIREIVMREEKFSLRPPADDEAISRAEQALGTAFPEALRELYRVTDGVEERWDGSNVSWYPFWPLEQVVASNLEEWASCYADDMWPQRFGLIGFADNGAGEPYCVARDGSSEKVSLWEPIPDEVNPKGDTVAAFLLTEWVEEMDPPPVATQT